MSNAEVLGRFVWHELLTTDTAAAAAFYPKVVPWRTAPSSMPGYTIWMAGQTQIGGLMALPADGGTTPPHWLIYLGTPNVDATCSQAQGLGAQVLKAPADIPNVGRYAVLSDPQGSTFALFTPGSEPPPGPQPAQGAFSWHELATTDVPAALRFYGTLFGWTKGPAHDMGGGAGVYQIFEHNGTGVGGMADVQGLSTVPSWLSYVHVADSGRAVAAAKSGGGRVLGGPREVPGGSWIAWMTDPQGSAFAVLEAPRSVSQPKPAATAKPPAATKPAAAPPKPATAPLKPAAAAKPARPPAKPPKLAAAAAPARPPAKPPKPAAALAPARPPAKPARKKAAKKAVKKAAKKVARKATRKKAAAKRVRGKAARRTVTRSARRAAPKKRTAAKRARGRRR